MISKKYIAKALLKQRNIWKHIFKVKSIKKNEKWYKIVIHSLKINIFNMKIEMKYLRIELKKYNSELKLIINSIWLSKGENKARKNHALTILTFKIEAEAQRHLKKWLLAARSTYQTVEYQDYWSNDQCQKCQTFKHLQNKCNRSSRCVYCERNHQIINVNYLRAKTSNHAITWFLDFWFLISSLSACSLWLWHCLDAVHMLDYMYLDQSRCFISSHWSITLIVCANKHFQSNNFSLSCFHFLVSSCSSLFTLSFLIVIFLLQFKYFSSTLTLRFFQSWW